jgi:hypothetical protein
MAYKILVILSFFFTQHSFGQNLKVENNSSLKTAKLGTFQFIKSTSKFEYVYTTNTLEYIESERKQEDDVLIQLNEYVSVYIPSRAKIYSNSFIPLETEIYK